MALDLYINGEQADLYADEAIKLGVKLKDFRDVTKPFGDFTNEFTIPASSQNNLLLARFADPEIIEYPNRVDYRIKQPAYLDIDGVQAIGGFITYNKCIYKDNKMHGHVVAFTSTLLNLKEIFGDARLSDLNLTQYDHPNDPATVVSGLTTGLFIYDEDGEPDIRYSLMTNNETDWKPERIYNGIPSEEFRPSIRVDAIFRAINNDYPFEINFTQTNVIDYLATSYPAPSPNPDFNENINYDRLYLWCGNKPPDNVLPTTSTSVPDWSLLMDFTPPLTYKNSDLVIYDEATGQWSVRPFYYPELFRMTFDVQPSNSDPYTIQIFELKRYSNEYNTPPVYQIAGLTGAYTGTVDYITNYDVFLWYRRFIAVIKSDNDTPIQFTWDFTLELVFGGGQTGLNGPQNGFRGSNNLGLSTQPLINRIDYKMPNMKLIDFVKDFATLYNCVLWPDKLNRDKYWLEPYDEWRDLTNENRGSYLNNNINLTDQTEIISHKVIIPEIPKTLNITYANPKAINNKSLKEFRGIGYGDAKLVLGELGTGDDYDIKLKFENMMWNKRTHSTLSGETYLIGQAVTNIGTGVDGSGYINGLTGIYDAAYLQLYNGGDFQGRITVTKDGETTIATTGHRIFNCYSNNQTKTLNYGVEIDYSTGEVPVSGTSTLFETVYEGYMQLFINPTSRISEFKLKLTPVQLNILDLYKTVEIGDAFYSINKYTYNSLDGSVDLELIRYLRDYETLNASTPTDFIDPEFCELFIEPNAVPTTPCDLTATTITSTSFTLGWGQSTSETNTVARYEIFRNGQYFATQPDPNILTLDLTGLVPAATNAWTVQAVDDTGLRSDFCNPYEVTMLAPTNPTFVNPVMSGNSGGSFIFITWEPAIVGRYPLSHYNVYLNGSYKGRVNVGDPLQFTLSNLNLATEYEIQVGVFDNFGLSDFSDKVYFSTTDIKPEFTNPITFNPDSDARTSTIIPIKWSAATIGAFPIDYYEVFLDGILESTIPAADPLEYTFTGLTLNATLPYEIDASVYDTGGKSDISITLNACPQCDSVSTLSGSPATNSITIQWDPVNIGIGDITYHFEIRESGDAWPGFVEEIASPHQINGLTLNTDYDIRLYTTRAGYFLCTLSEPSNVVSTTTLGFGTPTLTNLSVTQTSITNVWTDVVGATGYTYQYRVSGDTTWSAATTQTSPSTQFGLIEGQDYEFRVRALGDNPPNNFSDWSNTLVTKPAITSLLNNIFAYYKLDDLTTSGTGNMLSDNATGVAAYDAGVQNSSRTATAKINTGWVRTTQTTAEIWAKGGTWISKITPFSINQWVRPISIADNGNGVGLVNGWPNYRLELWPVGETRFWMGDVTNTNNRIYFSDLGMTVSVNNWHMVTITYDGSGLSSGFKFYHNGVETTPTNSGNEFDTFTGGGSEMYFAGGGDSGSIGQNGFDGYLDEIGTWQKQLNPTEVSDLYNSGAALQYPFFTAPPTFNDPITVVSADSQNILVDWSAATSGSSLVNRYDIYFDGSFDGSVLSGETLEYQFTGLNNSTAYEIFAVAVSEDSLSGQSSTITGTTSAAETPIFNDPITLVNATISTIEISWSAATAVSGISLTNYVTYIDGVSASTINIGNPLEYTFSGLTIDTFYDIDVKVFNDYGYSGGSSILSATTLTTLDTPVLVNEFTSNTVVINTWDSITQATGYTHEYKLSSDTAWTATTDNTSPATVSGLTTGETYNFRVKALASNSANDSPFSNIITATTVSSILNGVIAYYKLDETTGTVLDATGTYDAFNSGATPNVTGKINTGYQFTVAEDDYIQTTSAVSGLTGDFTVSAWVNLTGLSYVDGIVSSVIPSRGSANANFSLCVGSLGAGDELTAYAQGSSPIFESTGAGLTTGVWYHIAYVHDDAADSISFYVNGVAKGVGTPFTPNTFIYPITIGNYFSSNAGNTPQGTLDEIGIWGRKLTDNEIIQLYDSGSGNQYPFNQPTVLDTPVLVNVSATTTSITNSWDSIGGATGYTHEYKLTGDTIWTGTSANVSPATVTGLTESATYNFRVKALASNPIDDSAFSNVLTATTSIAYTPKTVTAVGDAQMDTAQSKFGDASGLFDGTGDWLTIPDSDEWDWSGDATIDFWFRVPAGANGLLFGQGDANNNCWGLGLNQSPAVLEWAGYNSGSLILNWNVPGLTFTPDTWYHLELSRSTDNTWRIFIDGVEKTINVLSGSLSTALTPKASPLYIGGNGIVFIGFPLEGHIDEFRFSNDIVRHTANFTPETAAYTVDANTSLLLHMDGPDSSQNFIDGDTSTYFPKTVTAFGDAQIDTAQFKFGDASDLFDGTGDYLTTPDSLEWDLGTGDFTIECWVRLNAAGSFVVAGQEDAATSFWGMIIGTTAIGFASITGGAWDVNFSSGLSLSTGTWYHIAVTRNGTDVNGWHLFVDGVEQTKTLNIGAYTGGVFAGTGTLNIGYNDGKLANAFNGHIDEFRFSKGIARWTSGFTPPAAPYTTDANTNLLLHMDGTDGSTTFIDGDE